MKSLILSLIFFIVAFNLNAQTIKLDSVYLLDGNIALIQITKVTPEKIEYTYPEETLVNVMPLNSIKYIVFKSGRKQQFNSQANSDDIIKNIKPEEVTIIYTKPDLSDYTEVGEIESEKARYYGAKVKLKVEALDQLRVEAAAKGGNHVLVTSENFVRIPINTYSFKGIVYYKE